MGGVSRRPAQLQTTPRTSRLPFPVCRPRLPANLRQLPLLHRDLHVLLLDVQPQQVERAHVHIRDPHHGKPSHNIPPPPCIQQLKPEQDQRQRSDIVRKTVLAGEQIEKFALRTTPRSPFAFLACRNRVGSRNTSSCVTVHASAGNRQSQQQQHGKLVQQRDRESSVGIPHLQMRLCSDMSKL